MPLPRFVIAKRLADGRTAFYFTVPTRYRKLGCGIPNEPLGPDYATACGEDGNGGRAKGLNELFNEWMKTKSGEPIEGIIRYGSISWLFREYRLSKAYSEKVSARSRGGYERTMLLVADLRTERGDKVGDRPIKAVTPGAADRIYGRLLEGPHGPRPRQAEKVVGLCARAWSVVHRLHPELFDRDVPNPWNGVVKIRRIKAAKPAATRDQVYEFVDAAIAAGYPEAAAAAVICFEWLQRPENVIGGFIRWTDYRGREAPTALRITHHKTGAVVLHPLDDKDGTQFYADAEAVLAKVPRRGIPIILRETKDGTAKLYSANGMTDLVRRIRKLANLPDTFTLDACRHGGMTELEEAELTDGQGRALSAHKSRAYEGYAKRTMERALAATRKRHAHLQTKTNASRTSVQNEARNSVQNEPGRTKGDAK
jgi:hypothetical protein